MNPLRDASQDIDHEHGQMFVAKLSRRGAIGAFAAFGLGLLVSHDHSSNHPSDNAGDDRHNDCGGG